MDSESSLGGERQHVPKELVEDILLTLPVKSLLRFKCISKSWKYLICSQKFIRKHLQNSTKKKGFPNHRVIMFEQEQDSTEDDDSTEDERVPNAKQINLVSLLNDDPSIDLSPMADDPTNKNIGSSSWFRKKRKNGWRFIVGCCNGLVCIVDVDNCFFLWNPATRISRKLPPIIIHNGKKPVFIIMNNSGFGCDESSGAYKVFVIVDVLITRYDWSRYYKVYSSKTNSWKTLVIEPFSFNYPLYKNTGTYAAGKIHWLHIHRHNIVSFNLKSEEFGMIELPRKPESEYSEGLFKRLWLGEIGGCLGLVCGFDDPATLSFDVWVMKEDEEEEGSWFKLATISRDYHYPPIPFPFTIFQGGPDGELSLLYGPSFSIVYYDSDYKNFVHWRHSSYEVSVYVESLVSPPETKTDSGWRCRLPKLCF